VKLFRVEPRNSEIAHETHGAPRVCVNGARSPSDRGLAIVNKQPAFARVHLEDPDAIELEDAVLEVRE
jgi:hypothetical protein